MKPTAFKVLLSLGVLAFVALMVRGCSPGTNPYMASLGITVPNSAVQVQKNYPGLTSDETLLFIQLSPTQIPALLAQFKKQPNYLLEPLDTSRHMLAPSPQFFSPVPRGALCGTFRIDHTETKPAWPTLCAFAIDKSTGRLWFYGTDIYN